MLKKRIVFPIVVILGVALWVFMSQSGGVEKPKTEEGPAKEKPVAVKTAAVTRGSIHPSLTISGSVAGAKEIELTAKTQGTIVSLGARTGDRVKAGQVVVVLESQNQQLAVAKSQEQVASARLNLEKAKIAFNRVDELYKQEAVSQAEYDDALFMLQGAQVAYNVALSDNQLASKALSDTTVVAPFSGSVVQCSVEQGQTVFPGKDLMTVVDDSRLKVKANLNADQLKLAKVGQRGVFITSACNGKEFACTVTSISSKANPDNLTYAVELSLSEDASRQLKPGMFGQVRLNTAEINRNIIPQEAVITLDESGNAEVFLVKNGKAFKSQIQTGEADDKNTAVIAGLKPGDRVVTFGQSLLRDGTAVTEGE
ncbi:MAG: efflux RND transporter periplasmic adaptor subunit [Bacillota bacterium]